MSKPPNGDIFGMNTYLAMQGLAGRPRSSREMIVGTTREQRRAAERAALKAARRARRREGDTGER